MPITIGGNESAAGGRKDGVRINDIRFASKIGSSQQPRAKAARQGGVQMPEATPEQVEAAGRMGAMQTGRQLMEIRARYRDALRSLKGTFNWDDAALGRPGSGKPDPGAAPSLFAQQAEKVAADMLKDFPPELQQSASQMLLGDMQAIVAPILKRAGQAVDTLHVQSLEREKQAALDQARDLGGAGLLKELLGFSGYETSMQALVEGGVTTGPEHAWSFRRQCLETGLGSAVESPECPEYLPDFLADLRATGQISRESARSLGGRFQKNKDRRLRRNKDQA